VKEWLAVVYDQSFLPIGPDGSSAPITWSQLKIAAERDYPVVWEMLGEYRMIPAALVQETWGLVYSYMQLVQLGRLEQCFAPPGFVRQQTVPLPDDCLKDRPGVVYKDSNPGSDNRGPA
jgi:hypothetical protein